MEKKIKTNIKNYNNLSKKGINPFRINENYYSSKRLGIFDYGDNTNMKKKHLSDRKLLKLSFNENQKNQRRKTIKETKNINIIKLKTNINNVNIISISSINNENIIRWKQILYNHNRAFSITQLNESKNYNDDQKILNQNDNNVNNFYNSDDIDLIKKDVVRTRVNETKIIKNYDKNLELLIKYFINENKVKYKQGLNEVIGAFLLLKYSNVKEDFTFSEIYNLLNGFINLFIFNYYYEESIYSIKNSFSLLSLLLKYHSPEIYNIFDKAMVCPEMYATSWLLTVFAYKLKLNTLFYFWNKIILENDQLIMHYLIVALLLYKKNCFKDNDIGSIPIIINRLSIETEQDIDQIYKCAIDLRSKTPYSFRLFAQKLDVLKHKSKQHKVKYDLYHPDQLICLPILPSEIFYICYKNIIKCPDENHIKNNYIKENCEHCDMKIVKDINYILFDLRISEKGKFDSNSEKTGFLPQMIMIDQKELKDDNFINIINNRFNDVKDKYHFIFMISKIDLLNIDNSDNNNNKVFEYKKEKDNKDLSHKGVKVIKLDKKFTKKVSFNDKNNIKEYDNLKKLLLYLIDNNYKYISYIYGGFEKIHNEIMNNTNNNIYSEINLLNHNDKKCYICKSNKKMSKAHSPKISKVSLISKNILKSISPKKHSFMSKTLKEEKEELNSIEIIKNDIINSNCLTNNNSKKDINENKIITIDEVNKMISNTQYFAGPCRFINSQNKNISEKNNDNQGLLIIYNMKLYAIKTSIYNNKPMQIINEILLCNLKDLKIKSKLYAHIDFINNKVNKNGKKNIKESLIVKFNYEQDSEKFLSSINKAKKINS